MLVVILVLFLRSDNDLLPPSTIQTLTTGSHLVVGIPRPLPGQQQSPTSSANKESVLRESYFASFADPSEILHSLSLLNFILSHPVCKQAFLDVLSHEDSP